MKNLIVFILFISWTLNSNAQIADSAQRKVPLKGAANFRDLGGYKTQDGHHVKWAKIYRSADISKLTDSDLSLLSKLHISYDVDLRGNEEVQKAPDKLVPNMHYLQCPAGSNNLGQMMKDISMAKTKEQGDSIMVAYYGNTTYFKDRYQPFFNTLLNLPSTESLVFHCSAGKDRTGIGAFLLLYALGVPYSTIVEDFEASNYYRKSENEKMLKTMVQYMKASPEAVKEVMSVRKEFLDASLGAIQRQYGSVDNFLKSEIGLDKEKIKALRNKFLD